MRNRLVDIVFMSKNKFFKNSFFILNVFLLLFITPLFFHTSPKPYLFSYSAFYIYGCLCLFLSVFLYFFVISLICEKNKSFNYLFLNIALMISVSLFLLIFEVFLIFKFQNSDSFQAYRQLGHKKSIVFGFEAKPNHQWTKFGADYTTDQFGFRTNLRNPEYEKNYKYKIFTLGGSSVFGYGLNDNETWSHLLEGKLQKNINSEISVINAGNNGYNSLQTFLRFYLRVLPLGPTHIIFYEAMNDFNFIENSTDTLTVSPEILFSNSIIDYWKTESRNFNLYIRSLTFYFILESVPFLKKWKPTSQKYHEKNLVENQKFNWKEFIKITNNNSMIYYRNVKALITLCKANKVMPILVTFIQNFEYNKPSIAITQYNKVLRMIANEENVLLFDLEKEFADKKEKEKYFFSDHYHPTKTGAEYIASSLNQFLKKNVSECFGAQDSFLPENAIPSKQSQE